MRAIRQRAGVFLATQPFQLIEYWTENVGLVIRDRAGKIGEILRALNNRYSALEAHSRIDVAGRERNIFYAAGVTASGYRFGIELDENQIPNLDAARIFFVHERATRVAVRRKIDMHFRARSARAGVAHHPEIVGLPTVENVNLWIEIGFAKQTRPVFVRFLVELAWFVGSGLVNCRVKALCRKIPALDE